MNRKFTKIDGKWHLPRGLNDFEITACGRAITLHSWKPISFRDEKDHDICEDCLNDRLFQK